MLGITPYDITLVSKKFFLKMQVSLTTTKHNNDLH